MSNLLLITKWQWLHSVSNNTVTYCNTCKLHASNEMQCCCDWCGSLMFTDHQSTRKNTRKKGNLQEAVRFTLDSPCTKTSYPFSPIPPVSNSCEHSMQSNLHWWGKGKRRNKFKKKKKENVDGFIPQVSLIMTEVLSECKWQQSIQSVVHNFKRTSVRKTSKLLLRWKGTNTISITVDI